MNPKQSIFEIARDLIDAANRADNLALATDILLGTTLLGAGATVYLLVTANDTSEDSSTSRTIVPSVGPGHAGVSLNTSF